MRISSTTFNAHCFSRGISDKIALQRDRLLMGLAAHACCAAAPAGENAAGRGVNAAGTPWPAQPGPGSRYFCLGLKGEACTLVPKEPKLERRATSCRQTRYFSVLGSQGIPAVETPMACRLPGATPAPALSWAVGSQADLGCPPPGTLLQEQTDGGERESRNGLEIAQST